MRPRVRGADTDDVFQNAARLFAQKIDELRQAEIIKLTQSKAVASRRLANTQAGGSRTLKQGRRATSARRLCYKRDWPRAAHEAACQEVPRPGRPLDDIGCSISPTSTTARMERCCSRISALTSIKIEPPGHGEGDACAVSCAGREISIGFAILNVNKRCANA